MDVSIIILNYKQSGLVKYCVKGILMSNISLKHEIIVVDNHSGDSCIEMIHDNFPEVVTVESDKNRGFAGGNNLGIQKAQGKYIIILNPDVAVVEGVIETLHQFMESHLDVGIAGPKLVNPDGSIQYSSRRFPTVLALIFRRTIAGRFSFLKKYADSYLMKDFDHLSNIQVDWLFGACLIIRKSALDAVGLFDSRFFIYFEDLDLCRRFWEKNFQVYYIAKATLTHYHQRLSAGKIGIFSLFNHAMRIHIYSAFRYFKKYRGKNAPR